MTFKFIEIQNKLNNRFIKKIRLINPKLVFNNFSNKKNPTDNGSLTFDIKKEEGKDFKNYIDIFLKDINHTNDQKRPFLKEVESDPSIYRFSVKEDLNKKKTNNIGYNFLDISKLKDTDKRGEPVTTSFLETEPDLNLCNFIIEGSLYYNSNIKSMSLNFSYYNILIIKPHIDFTVPSENASHLVDLYLTEYHEEKLTVI